MTLLDLSTFSLNGLSWLNIALGEEYHIERMHISLWFTQKSVHIWWHTGLKGDAKWWGSKACGERGWDWCNGKIPISWKRRPSKHGKRVSWYVLWGGIWAWRIEKASSPNWCLDLEWPLVPIPHPWCILHLYLSLLWQCLLQVRPKFRVHTKYDLAWGSLICCRLII